MSEPSEPPYSPIRPMASLEATNTPAAPSSGGPPPSLEAAPSSGCPPQSLEAAPSFGGLPPSHEATPSSGGLPLYFEATPSSGGPPPYPVTAPSPDGLPPSVAATMQSVLTQSQTSPSTLTHATPPPFPNSGVPNQYIVPPLLPFFFNTTGSSKSQTTSITPFVNSLYANNTIIGPSITPQPHNHPLLMASTASASPLALYQQIPMAQQPNSQYP
uniref:Uncharacterized protein n=1 Tax=Lactuca sativa TaxID=4236 RepID=A0A9R1XSW6_LACSA|nr:hypothetical protein LSAT_V11C100021430 [Lactuca sativa]